VKYYSLIKHNFLTCGFCKKKKENAHDKGLGKTSEEDV